jgi:competence protein ComEC
VLSAVPIRNNCASPSATIDRFDVWRYGAHAIWVDDSGAFRIESVAASLGDRPWVLDRMRRSFPRTNDPQPPGSEAASDPPGANRPSESNEADDE